MGDVTGYRWPYGPFGWTTRGSQQLRHLRHGLCVV